MRRPTMLALSRIASVTVLAWLVSAAGTALAQGASGGALPPGVTALMPAARQEGELVVFGVTFSLVLTLYVVPVVYGFVAKNTRSPEYISHLIDRLRSDSSKPSRDGEIAS